MIGLAEMYAKKVVYKAVGTNPRMTQLGRMRNTKHKRQHLAQAMWRICFAHNADENKSQEHPPNHC